MFFHTVLSNVAESIEKFPSPDGEVVDSNEGGGVLYISNGRFPSPDGEVVDCYAKAEAQRAAAERSFHPLTGKWLIATSTLLRLKQIIFGFHPLAGKWLIATKLRRNGDSMATNAPVSIPWRGNG